MTETNTTRAPKSNGMESVTQEAEIKPVQAGRPIIDMAGLAKPQDFYDLTYAFIKTCQDNNVRHVEIMFGPMAHLQRGVSFADQFEAMERARLDGQRDFGVSVLWIMCIDREYSSEEAMELLESAEPYRDSITGLGLASYEKDNPPNKFLAAYTLAKERGYRLTAHCDCPTGCQVGG